MADVVKKFAAFETTSKAWIAEKTQSLNQGLYPSFLPDPGVSGVRSMGPGLSNSLRDFGWNFADVTLTDDDTNSIRLMMPILSNPLQFVINVIYASRTSWWSKQNCRNSRGKMKYNSDYQKYGDTNIARGTTDPGYWVHNSNHPNSRSMLIVESTLLTWSALFDLFFAFEYFYKTQEVVFLVFVSPYFS